MAYIFSELVREFVFNVPPAAKVIWRWCHCLKSQEQGIELGTPGYKVRGLSTTVAPFMLNILYYKSIDVGTQASLQN